MSFSEIPDSYRVPGVFVEVDPTVAQSGPGVFPFRALIIGQTDATGSVVAGTVKRTTRVTQAREEHGAGSISHLLAKAWLEENEIVELDVVSLADGGAVSATGTITIAGTITTPGTLFLYIAGTRFTILAQTDPTTVAAAIVTAINADTDLPVTAANVAGLVTLTPKNGGTFGNAIDIRINHLAGEEIPGALTVAIVAMAGGSGDPTLATVFAAIAGTRYDVICHAMTDTANLNALQTEIEARADALVGEPGMGISGIADSQSNLTTLGDARNNKFEALIGMEVFPGIGQLRAAAVAAQAARFLQDDPVRPVTGRNKLGGFGPTDTDKFTNAERNLLLHDGISTLRYDRSNIAEVERLITTYQDTTGGSPDESFLDIQTLFGLSFARRSYVAHFARQFPNHKLADNGTPAGPGSVVVTPDIALADAVGWYKGLIREGICEDIGGFKANSFARRHASDPNRLEIFLAVNFVNQLRVTAALLQFRR